MPSKLEISPLPWRLIRASNYTGDAEHTDIQSIEAADGSTVYYTEGGYFKPKEADVALVLASPAMYRALEAFELEFGEAVDKDEEINGADAVEFIIGHLYYVRQVMAQARGEKS